MATIEQDPCMAALNRIRSAMEASIAILPLGYPRHAVVKSMTEDLDVVWEEMRKRDERVEELQNALKNGEMK